MAEQLWRRLNEAAFLIVPLLLVGLVSLLTFWLPQSPVPLTETATFFRWVTSIRPRLDPYTEGLATWGLLSLKTTLWLRLPLALLALALAARAVTLREQWAALPPLARVRRLLVLLGLAGILAGWSIQLRWGWSETEIYAWPGEPVQLAHFDHSLPPPKESQRLQWRGFGLFLFQENLALGLDIQARNDKGDMVPLLLSAQSAAQEQIRLILHQQRPDGYFGIPEADLVFRVTLQELPPEPKFHVQIYRTSSGALLTETVLNNNGVIFTEGLQLQLNSLSIPQLRAVYNPGAPVSFAAWGILAAAGILCGFERRQCGKTQDSALSAAPENRV